jgi:hypothetical protein
LPQNPTSSRSAAGLPVARCPCSVSRSGPETRVRCRLPSETLTSRWPWKVLPPRHHHCQYSKLHRFCHPPLKSPVKQSAVEGWARRTALIFVLHPLPSRGSIGRYVPYARPRASGCSGSAGVSLVGKGSPVHHGNTLGSSPGSAVWTWTRKTLG